MRRESEFLYKKLAGTLREQILSGYIKPGQFLLSENELCRYYDMSRTSVRKSLEELLKEGLIVKKVGQGTIVSPDLIMEKSDKRALRILALSPSHFIDICLPLVIEQFQQQHPDVEVKCLSLPASSFWESFRACRDIGIQADIVFAGDLQYNEMDESGPFLNLNEPLRDAIAELYPALRRAFGTEEHMKALPVTFSPVYLAYNPQLFDKYGVAQPHHGWTKADFLQAAQRLTLDSDSDGIVDQYALSLSPSLQRWPQIALQHGVRFNGNTGKDSIVKTLTSIHDLLYRYRIATLSIGPRINSEAFVKEKAAMTLTTFIEHAGWRNERIPFEPRIASMPFGEQQASLLIGNVMMIPEHGNEEELAISFLRTVIHPKTQEAISREKNFLSVLWRVNDRIYDKEQLSSLNMMGDSIPNGSFLFELFPDLDFAAEVENEMELYWGGLESAPQFADRLLRILQGNK